MIPTLSRNDSVWVAWTAAQNLDSGPTTTLKELNTNGLKTLLEQDVSLSFLIAVETIIIDD